MGNVQEELKRWMGTTGHTTAKAAAEALGLSRSAIDRVINGHAGDFATKKVQERLATWSDVDHALEHAITAVIVSALLKRGFEATLCSTGQAGWDMLVDGVPVQIKIGNPTDAGKAFIERLAGIPQSEDRGGDQQ